jgi:hypothetical protein
MGWLNSRNANGIIFTTMQKFEESDEALSERRNIIVIADEAHRSQYGLSERIKMVKYEDGEDEAKRVIGTARIIRDCLPNATFIGFTGTPVSSKDHNTRAVFGDYIDVYDMTQAVEDGATRPVYYESRVVKLNLDEELEHARPVHVAYAKFMDFVNDHTLVSLGAFDAQSKLLTRAARYSGVKQITNGFFDVLDYADEVLESGEMFTVESLLGRYGLEPSINAMDMARNNVKVFERIRSEDNG